MLSKSKRRANAKWDASHQRAKKIYRYRSAWRHFYKYDATLQDLHEGHKLAVQRKKKLLNK